MSDLLPITDAEKISELKREVDMRRHVFPKQVAAGKMSMGKMVRRIEIIESVIKDYEDKQFPREK